MRIAGPAAMKLFALVLCTGCVSMGREEPQPIDHVYTVTARQLGSNGTCDDPGQTADPAIPYRELASSPDFPGQQAWEWCDSQTVCDPIGSFDWFSAQSDHWQRVSAQIINAPDNGTACDLQFATLTVTVGQNNVHVDLLEKDMAGDLNNCTTDQALQLLQNSIECNVVDRYDLAP
jgi:hypothetical protein